MFNTTYESLPEIDQKMLAELSSIYKQFEQSEDPLWTDKYSFQTQPLMLIKTNKDQGILQKTAYVVNVPMDNDFFSKEIIVPKSLGLPKIYRISLLQPRNLKTWMPNNSGTLQLKDQEIMYYKYYPKVMNNPELYFDFFPSYYMNHFIYSNKICGLLIIMTQNGLKTILKNPSNMHSWG